MFDSYGREGHSVISCPVCAKNGNGRGALQSYFQAGETACLRCAVCSWKGDYGTVQRFSFPCKIYQVVDIDLVVLENLFSVARQLKERVKFDLPSDAKIGSILEFAIERLPNGPLATELKDYCDLNDALSYLTAKGWLFPAVYRVKVDV